MPALRQRPAVMNKSQRVLSLQTYPVMKVKSHASARKTEKSLEELSWKESSSRNKRKERPWKKFSHPGPQEQVVSGQRKELAMIKNKKKVMMS